MSKYIDADDLYTLIDNCVSAPYDGEKEVKNEILSIIAEKKGADVEPVRHGKWIYESNNGRPYAYCTACKTKMNPTLYGYGFCPFCGAKMNG